MSYLEKIMTYKLETLLAILLVIFALLLFGKINIKEGASGFYLIRPTSWSATPTRVEIDLTSFYPANLVCDVNTPYGSRVVEIQPRSTSILSFSVNLTPNTLVKLPVVIDCGVIKEEGRIILHVST